MARRKDNKGRILRTGEYQTPTGYEYKWKDVRGKRHSRSAPTLEQLREIQKEILKDSFTGKNLYGDKTTLNDIYYRWFDIKRGLRKNTFRNYRYMYERFVEREFGTTKLKDLTRSEIRNFYNSLAADLGLKVSTIDSIHTVIHQVLEVAIDDDIIRYNPSDNAMTELKKSGVNASKKRKAMTQEEQKLFEDFLSSSEEFKRWFPVFTVLLWTGLRVGEITALQWEHVNFEKGIIEVKHSLVYGPDEDKGYCTFAMNEPKTKAGKRVVPMNSKVKDAFLLEKQRQKEEGIKCVSVVDGFDDFVFLNRFGEVQHQGTLNKALRRIVKACNAELIANSKGKKDIVLVPRLSNHILRHTYVTRLNDANINPKVAAQIVGHSETRTTLNIYTDVFNDKIRTEMQEFNRFYSV